MEALSYAQGPPEYDTRTPTHRNIFIASFSFETSSTYRKEEKGSDRRKKESEALEGVVGERGVRQEKESGRRKKESEALEGVV